MLAMQSPIVHVRPSANHIMAGFRTGAAGRFDMTSESNAASGRLKRVAKGINSVEVGYRVLIAVQLGPGAVGLSEIARRAGLSAGAAHNYLTSLVRTGLVEQEDRGRYRLGPSAFALSLASFRQLNGYDIVRHEALALHQLTDQSVAVAVWSQGGPVSIYTLRSQHAGAFTFRSGQLPLLASGGGLLFTAYLPETETVELLERELAAAGDPRKPHDVIVSAREALARTGYARYAYGTPVPFSMSVPIWSNADEISFLITIVVHQPIDQTTEALWFNELRAAAHRGSLLVSQCGASGPRAAIIDPR